MVGKKKIDFDLSKYQICFVVCRKKVFFGDKNSDLCLFHKIKFFFLFEKYQIYFYELKKIGFYNRKNQICFMIN